MLGGGLVFWGRERRGWNGVCEYWGFIRIWIPAFAGMTNGRVGIVG